MSEQRTSITQAKLIRLTGLAHGSMNYALKRLRGGGEIKAGNAVRVQAALAELGLTVADIVPGKVGRKSLEDAPVTETAEPLVEAVRDMEPEAPASLAFPPLEDDWGVAVEPDTLSASRIVPGADVRTLEREQELERQEAVQMAEVARLDEQADREESGFAALHSVAFEALLGVLRDRLPRGCKITVEL